MNKEIKLTKKDWENIKASLWTVQYHARSQEQEERLLKTYNRVKKYLKENEL